MAEALRTGRPVRGREAIAERPDGTRVNFIPYPTPITDERGKTIGAINMLVDITDRKKSEEELARSEARLRDFVESTTIGLHWVGPDGIILWANQAEMDLLGYSREEYIGRHIAEFHADSNVIDDILGRLGRLERLKDYEARLRCKDGSIRHVLIDSSVYTENGEFIHTRCFTRDITSQKFSEQQLVANARVSQILSRAKSQDSAFRAVLDSLAEYFEADIGEIWLGDGNLRCVSFFTRLQGKLVKKFEQAAGALKLEPGTGLPGIVYKRAEPVWMENILEKAPLARHREAEKLGLVSGFGLPIFSRGRCRGALTFFTAKPLHLDQSLLVMMSGLGHEIGQFIDRIDQQQANEHLAAVIEASQDAVVSASLDDVILSWNKGAERLFGYSAEEAIGSHVSLLLPPRAEAARNRRIAQLKRGETIEPYETVRRKKTGEQVYVSLGFSPVHNSRGELVAVAAIARDITKRKLAEKQLRARIEQLHAISELGITALCSNDVNKLYDLTVEHLTKGLDVEFAKVLELRPDGDLLLKAGAGWREGLVGQAILAGGLNSQAGYALSVDKPVIVANLSKEKRFNPPQMLMEHGVVSGLSTVIRGEDDQRYGVIGAHTRAPRKFSNHDLHFIQSLANILAMGIQKKSYIETQLMLKRELSHRVKNTMSVVQSVARMAGQHAECFEDFIENLEGRLTALSQSQDMLIASNWSGASFKKMIGILLGSGTLEGRIETAISDVKLEPEATQAIMMVLHELMTNASKYGALSNDKGKIEITSQCNRTGDEPLYRISWRENGGPPVSEPKRNGYGTKLLRWTVERKCCGKLDLDWRREGLCVEIEVPLAAIT